MPGTAADAALALESFYYKDDIYLIGEGSTRYAYLINGVVYKVEGDRWDTTSNLSEFEYISNMRSTLPTGLFYPEVSLFEISGRYVLAAEYIPGIAIAECFCIKGRESCTDSCMSDEIMAFVSPHLVDVSGMNVIVNDNGIYIIDAN